MIYDQSDNSNRHFQGQQKTEKVFCFTRKHPIVLLRLVSIASGLGIALTIVIVAMLTSEQLPQNTWMQGLLFIMILFLTVTHQMLFLKILNYYLEIVIITSYRIIDMKKSIFIQDDKEIIDLHEIQDIKKRQDGIWPNLLNYGNLIITVATMGAPMVLHNLPKPEYYFNQVNSTKRLYILERRKQKFEDPESIQPLEDENSNIGPESADDLASLSREIVSS